MSSHPTDLLQEITKTGLTQQLLPEINQLWKKFDVDSSGEMELPEARKFFTALFRWLVKNGTLHRSKVDSIEAMSSLCLGKRDR